MPNTSGINRSPSTPLNNDNQDLSQNIHNRSSGSTSTADAPDNSNDIGADFQNQLDSLSNNGGSQTGDGLSDPELLNSMDDMNGSGIVDLGIDDNGASGDPKQQITDLKQQIETLNLSAAQKTDLLNKLKKASAAQDLNQAAKVTQLVENVTQSLKNYTVQARVNDLKAKHVLSDQSAQSFIAKLETLRTSTSKPKDSDPTVDDINTQLNDFPVDPTTGEAQFPSDSPLTSLINLISPKPSATEVFEKIQAAFPDLGITSFDDLQQKMTALSCPPAIPNAQVLDFLKALDPALKKDTDAMAAAGAKGYIRGYNGETAGNGTGANNAVGDVTFLSAQAVAMDRVTLLLNAFYSGKGTFALIYPTNTSPQARNCISFTSSSSTTPLNLGVFQVAGYWGTERDNGSRKQFTNPQAGDSLMTAPPWSIQSRQMTRADVDAEQAAEENGGGYL